MAIEQTFAMIKPDAVIDGHTGAIISRIEKEGFTILRLEKCILERELVEEFYGEHKERPFFGEMVEGICAGPVVLMALERDNAVAAWRDLIGATDPAQAADNTLRKLYGKHIGSNAVHGSDAVTTAERELGLMFGEEIETDEA